MTTKFHQEIQKVIPKEEEQVKQEKLISLLSLATLSGLSVMAVSPKATAAIMYKGASMGSTITDYVDPRATKVKEDKMVKAAGQGEAINPQSPMLPSLIIGDAPEYVNDGSLDTIFSTAISQWEQVVPENDAMTMINYGWAELEDGILSQTFVTQSENNDNKKAVIVFNNNMNQWFVDATPDDNEEFGNFIDGVYSQGTGDAMLKYDLLTVASHELGHILLPEGQNGHSDNPNDLMYAELQVGERKLAVDLNNAVVINAPVTEIPEPTVTGLALGLFVGGGFFLKKKGNQQK